MSTPAAPDPDLQAALRGFLAYPAALAEVSATAQGVSIGRWAIVTTCRAGSSLLGGAPETTVTFDLDLPDLRQVVYGIRDRIEDRLELAWPAVTAVQAWADDDLPSIAPALTRIDAALSPDGSRSGPDGDLAGCLTDLDTRLARSTAVLGTAVTTIEQLVTDQLAHVRDVAALPDPLAAEARQRLRELLAVLDAAPCGQHDALEQFVHLQTELTASVGTLTSCVQELRRLTAATGQELTALAQAVTALQRDVGGLGRLVVEGELTREVAARELQLTATADVWTALAATATRVAAEAPLRSPLRTPSLRARSDAHRD